MFFLRSLRQSSVIIVLLGPKQFGIGNLIALLVNLMSVFICCRSSHPGISEVKTTTTKKAVEPKYKIVQDSVQGHPDSLIAEVRFV